MKITRIILFVAYFLCAAVAFAEDKKQLLTTEEILEEPEVKGALSTIDVWLKAKHIYDRIPGLSVGIVYGQDLIWSSGYGYSNLETLSPADADTIYSICSISKLFTAVSVMQLRDKKKLTLRDAVRDHLDWFDIKQPFENSGPVTIEGLLTHSSGLPRESDTPYWMAPDFPFPTREEMIEKLPGQSMLYPARSRYQYSNLGASIAGEVVQAQSGQDYQEYVKENILDPLGLENTRPYFPLDMHGKEMAMGYSGFDRSGVRKPLNAFFTGGITPAAGFTSTVSDLAKFASWQFRLLETGGDELLDAHTLKEMHRVHFIDGDDGYMFGLGFEVEQSDKNVLGHGGGCPGYSTNLLMNVKEKIAVIAMTNVSDGAAHNLTTNILKAVTAALNEAKTQSTEPMPDFSMYEGNFDGGHGGGELAVRQWGNKLIVLSLPRRDLEGAMTKLEYVKDNVFVRLTDKGERREMWRFEMANDGKAARMHQHASYWNRIE